MHTLILVAALSAYSPETTFTGKEVASSSAPAAAVEVSSSSWSWSDVFAWAKQSVGFLLMFR